MGALYGAVQPLAGDAGRLAGRIRCDRAPCREVCADCGSQGRELRRPGSDRSQRAGRRGSRGRHIRLQRGSRSRRVPCRKRHVPSGSDCACKAERCGGIRLPGAHRNTWSEALPSCGRQGLRGCSTHTGGVGRRGARDRESNAERVAQHLRGGAEDQAVGDQGQEADHREHRTKARRAFRERNGVTPCKWLRRP